MNDRRPPRRRIDPAPTRAAGCRSNVTDLALIEFQTRIKRPPNDLPRFPSTLFQEPGC